MISEIFQLVSLGENEEARRLLRNQDLNMVNEFGQGLLHECAAHNNSVMAQFLLEAGADINRQDKNGQTPLHYAASHSRLEIFSLLLEKGARCDMEDKYGNEVLWTATMNARGNYRLLELLLGRGLDARHPNKAGRSPLALAMQINDERMISLLNGMA